MIHVVIVIQDTPEELQVAIKAFAGTASAREQEYLGKLAEAVKTLQIDDKGPDRLTMIQRDKPQA